MSESPDGPFGILVSGDLFFTSKVTGTASSLGLRLNVMTDPEQVVASAQSPQCVCLLLDLTTPNAAAGPLISRLPSDPRPTVIAFGPHVQTARLEAAEQAGCDLVLPRSRFSAELPQLLQQAFSKSGECDSGLSR